jgi:apolipoprotein N-acyltransferase
VFEAHLATTRTITPRADRTAVVWPENVINITGDGTFAASRERDEIAAEARRLGVPFVVGITEDTGDGRFTNAQVVVQPDGSVTDRYDKKRRVPFGEYMPMRSILDSLGAPVELVPRDAVPGTAPGHLDVDGVRMAVAISWEVFFGGRVNEGIDGGAQVIVNPTNGSSYTWTILQTQQVASSRIRAREQGRWVLQVAPTGFSAFVSPDGEVLERTGISERRVIERTVDLHTGRTPYSRLGNAPYIWALLAALGFLLLRARGANRRGRS